MGRIRKSFKSHVENMVTCGLSKSYQQFESENLIIEDSVCNLLDTSSSLSTSETTVNMTKKSANLNKNRKNAFGYNCSECGHKGTIQNDELQPKCLTGNLKDKLNNENNNNSERLIRAKCDISTRKQTPDDSLLSCIVVNNDLHGENENKKEVPLSVSRAISGVKFSPSKHNGTIDAIIKGRFLQMFNTTSTENKVHGTSSTFCNNSSNQLQNKNLVTKQQRIQSSPYKMSSSTTENTFDFKRKNSKKLNNIENNLLQHNSNRHQYNQNTQSNKLSESSKCFPVETNATSLTLPSSLSDVLTTSCYDTNCLWAKVTRTEEVQLRNAAWYQPGLSREIVNEVLSDTSPLHQQLPHGTFLVRSSLTHPDSFALSIKVPLPISSSSSAMGSQGNGSSSSSSASIAHYLIIASLSHGYRINGSVKSFPTLYSLIVHHSVMKEVLPCTLNLSVAAGVTTICEQRFTQSNGTSQFTYHTTATTEEDVFSDSTTEEEEDVDEILSKDISDANYPDLLSTLRKALLESSFSEEKNNLISLS